MKLLLALALVCLVDSTYANHYILMAPKVIRPGKDYNFNLQLIPSPSQTVKVKVAVSRSSVQGTNAILGLEQTFTFSSGTAMQYGTFSIPSTIDAGSAYLTVEDIASYTITPGGKPIFNFTSVDVKEAMSDVYIQTDKGIYKPGQTVKIRALVVNGRLQPLSGTATVTIMDPSNNTMYENSNIDLDGSNGLYEGEFDLSKDPPMGEWMIEVTAEIRAADDSIAGVKTDHVKFSVDKYVLPRFEVKVQPDKDYEVQSFELDNVQISGMIKATYTYGKPVPGTATVSIMSPGLKGPKVIRADIPLNSDGEATFDVTVNDLQKIGQKFDIFGVVTEQYTDIEQNSSATFSIHEKHYKVSLIEPPPVYAPGLSYSAFVKITDPKGSTENFQTPAALNDVVVKYVATFSRPSTDRSDTDLTVEGEVIGATDNPFQFTIPATDIEGADQIKKLKIYGKLRSDSGYPQPSDYYPYTYKPSGSKTLTLAMLDDSMNEVPPTQTYAPTGNVVKFKVTGTQTITTLYYMVVCTTVGEARTMEVNDVTGTFQIDLMQSFAPKSTVLAYYFTNDKVPELIVASMTIKVQWNSNLQISITSQPDQEVRPGEDVTLNIEVSPAAQTMVGLLGVDKSTLLLDPGNDITQSRLMASSEKYMLWYQDDGEVYRPCGMWGCGIMRWGCWGGCPEPEKTGETKATADILKQSGVLWLGDTTVQGGVPDYSDYPMFRMFDDAVAFDGIADTGTEDGGGDVLPQPPPTKVRSKFPETWLWSIETTSAQGLLSLVKTTPDTITNWCITGFGINQANGLGVTDGCTEITTFQPFFIEPVLPYALTRGEQFELVMVVNNYKSQASEVQVRVERSDDYAFNITTAAGGWRRSDSEWSHTTLVPAQGSTAVRVIIAPLNLGKINITMYAESPDRSFADAVRREILVKPEGRQEKESVVAKPTGTVSVTPGNNAEMLFDVRHLMDIADLVNDTLDYKLQIAADIMGPTIENLESLLQMPSGCGEQNMISVVPNIFVTKYLQKINMFDTDARKRVIRYISTGYQKQQKYKHRDGSYTAFGETAGACTCWPNKPAVKGSTWLTALVLKAFSQVKCLDLIYVDSHLLGQAYDFIVGQADPSSTTSYFREDGKVIHGEMQGKTASGYGLTAYCLVALLEFNECNNKMSPGSRKVVDQTVLNGARKFLADRVSSTSDRYTLALMAYALSLHNTDQTAAKVAINKLLNMDDPPIEESEKTCPGYHPRPIPFEEGGVARDDVGICANLCDDENPCSDGLMCCYNGCGMTCQTPESDRSMYGTCDSGAVEEDGYYLMALLENGDPTFNGQASKLKSRLTQRQSDRGGFCSTQDTIVGLQAIAEYAIKADVSGYSLDFDVESPVGTMLDSFGMTRDNDGFAVKQIRDVIPHDASLVKVKVRGEGTANVKLIASYYVNNAKDGHGNKLKIDTETELSKNNTKFKLKACVKISGTLETSMLLLEAGIPAGWEVPENDLQKIIVDRADSIEMDEDQKINIYIPEDFAEMEPCFIVEMDKTMEVFNEQPSKVTIMDYYNVESQTTAYYSTSDPCVGDCDFEPTRPPVRTTEKPTTGCSAIRYSGLLLLVATLLSMLKQQLA